ncbi:MAG: PAS domain-containing sensor histidine kinase [Fulvivirga sp.]
MKLETPIGVKQDLYAVLDFVKGNGVSTENMFKALVEKSNDIILITGKDFVIKYVTGSVEKLLGIAPENALGKSLFEFIEVSKAKSIKNFAQCTDHKEDKFSEVSLRSVNGDNRYFDVTISNLLDNQRVNGLVINLHDITARKHTEEKLLKANNELDQFIYKTSHDLRAPLLTALGLVELAQKDPEKDKHDYLNMIKQSLQNLDNFIEDINSFYRNEKLAVRNERIDFDKIIKGEIENLRSANGTDIDINYNITRVAELISDSIRLKTVMTNVLSNAIKYSDPNKETSYVNVDVQITPDTCQVVVEDNGIGIREEYLKSIFDIFYRADENAKGSGLGLYIVKDTVDKLNGQIEVHSDYGKGTAFTITIPNFLSSN